MAHLGRQQALVGFQPPQPQSEKHRKGWLGRDPEIAWFCLVLGRLWTPSQAGHPSSVSLPQNVLQKQWVLPPPFEIPLINSGD